MPAFKVLREEYSENKLPPLCMSCGKPTNEVREKVFSCTPAWVFIFLPFALIRFLLYYHQENRRRMIAIPLCPRHEKQWLKRYSLLWGSLFTFITLLVLAFFDKGDESFLLFIAGVLGLLFWPMFALIIHAGTLRVVEFNDGSATFAGVSRMWILALKKQREDGAKLSN